MRCPRRHLFAIAVLAVVAWALPAGAAQAPEQEGVAMAEFTIVGHKFRIPKTYLTRAGDMAGRVLNNSGEAVFMRGIMPDIRPLATKWERKHYRGGEPLAEVVSFGIWNRSKARWIGPDPSYFDKENLKKCTGPKDGYLICPHDFDFYKKSHEVFVQITKRGPFVFDCDKLGSQLAPHCEIELPLFDAVELDVFFARKHFDRAQEIVARVYEIVCGYWVSDPNRKLTINHCK